MGVKITTFTTSKNLSGILCSKVKAMHAKTVTMNGGKAMAVQGKTVTVNGERLWLWMERL